MTTTQDRYEAAKTVLLRLATDRAKLQHKLDRRAAACGRHRGLYRFRSFNRLERIDDEVYAASQKVGEAKDRFTDTAEAAGVDQGEVERVLARASA